LTDQPAHQINFRSVPKKEGSVALVSTGVFADQAVEMPAVTPTNAGIFERAWKSLPNPLALAQV
jgi:hypothetical protein